MNGPAISLKPVVEPQKAVARFLKDMVTVAKRSFPAWQKTLSAGIEECPLNYDQRRSIIDIHPLDDYYFAGVVALEAAKIRALFAPDEASELLSLLAEQIDAAAERKDRVVSDLAFFIISRIELVAGIDKVEGTRHLMDEALFRHTLGEPLALGVPQWWKAFRTKYNLTGDIEQAPKEIRIEPPKTPKPVPPQKTPRRAVAFY